MTTLDADDDGQANMRAVVQFAFLRRPLAALLSACAAASLGLIVLKGAALAETVYASPAERPFGDLDVLVRAEDAPRAFAVLSGLGYICDPDIWAELLEGRSGEANFFRHTELGTVVVELHTDLLNNPLLRRAVRVDLAGLWARAVPARLAGQDAQALGPEDQIFHLCLHLAGHYFDAPKSVRDIAEVCAASPVEWPLFLQICRQAQADAIGYAGLLAAATRYGAGIPPSVMASLAPRSRRRLDRLVAAQTAPNAPRLSEAQRFELLWRLLGTAAARRFALKHLLLPSRAWLHAHYFYDLPDTPPFSRLPLGLRLHVRHAGFLAAALLRSRKPPRLPRITP